MYDSYCNIIILLVEMAEQVDAVALHVAALCVLLKTTIAWLLIHLFHM